MKTVFSLISSIKKVTKNEIKFFCFFLEWELLKGIDILLTADDLKRTKWWRKKWKLSKRSKRLSLSLLLSLCSLQERERENRGKDIEKKHFFIFFYVSFSPYFSLFSRPQVILLSQSSCVSPVGLADGRGGGRGAKSYDREKAWPSIHHSKLSSPTTLPPPPSLPIVSEPEKTNYLYTPTLPLSFILYFVYKILYRVYRTVRICRLHYSSFQPYCAPYK